jgi:hypothetical protein
MNDVKMMTLMRTLIVLLLLLLLAKDDVLSVMATSRAAKFPDLCVEFDWCVNLEEAVSTGMTCSSPAFSVNLMKSATMRQYYIREDGIDATDNNSTKNDD